MSGSRVWFILYYSGFVSLTERVVRYRKKLEKVKTVARLCAYCHERGTTRATHGIVIGCERFFGSPVKVR
jgi:hypothetical protein